MNRRHFTKLLLGTEFLLAGFHAGARADPEPPEPKESDSMQATTADFYTRTTPIDTVTSNPDETVDICNTLRQRADGRILLYFCAQTTV